MLLQVPVRAVRARLTELLAEWPDHPLLAQLAAITDRLLGEREAQSTVCACFLAFACQSEAACALRSHDGLGLRKPGRAPACVRLHHVPLICRSHHASIGSIALSVCPKPLTSRTCFLSLLLLDICEQ